MRNILGGYTTRAQNLAALAAGVIASAPGVVRLPPVAGTGTTAQALRRLLDKEEIAEAALRLALVGTVPVGQRDE